MPNWFHADAKESDNKPEENACDYAEFVRLVRWYRHSPDYLDTIMRAPSCKRLFDELPLRCLTPEEEKDRQNLTEACNKEKAPLLEAYKAKIAAFDHVLEQCEQGDGQEKAKQEKEKPGGMCWSNPARLCSFLEKETGDEQESVKQSEEKPRTIQVGCNTCKRQHDGSWSCTLIHCPPFEWTEKSTCDVPKVRRLAIWLVWHLRPDEMPVGYVPPECLECPTCRRIEIHPPDLLDPCIAAYKKTYTAEWNAKRDELRQALAHCEEVK